MAYTVVKTIGTSQNYTTLASWIAGAPADLTTSEKSACTTFITATFQIGETLNFVGSGAVGKLLETDSTGIGTGTYMVYGITSGNPATNDVITGATSGAKCTLTSGTPDVVGVIWQGQCANQEFSATSPVVNIQSITTSATAYVELTTKPGASFVDNANAQTNALFYNSANGACIKSTGSYGGPAVVNSTNYFRISKLQILGQGNAQGALQSSGTNLICSQMIFQRNGGASLLTSVFLTTAGPNTIKNSIIIATVGGLSYICRHSYSTTTTYYNCTVVTISSSTVATNGIAKWYGNLVLENVAIFGVTNATVLNYGATLSATTCFTNQASPPTGFTTKAYDTSTGSGFQNTTNDFRIKSGSALIDSGTTDATNAPTDIVGTTRPQGSAYDVGAWEYKSGGVAVTKTWGYIYG